MASVWAQLRETLQRDGVKPPRRLVGQVSLSTAYSKAKAFAEEWHEKFGPVREVWPGEYLLYLRGDLSIPRRAVGSVYVEAHSPPSAPEPGQPQAPRPAAGASRSANPRG